MRQPILAIIFDLDGVIVDTAHYHFLAWRRLADILHIPLSEADNEKLKGLSRTQSLEVILRMGGLQVAEEEKEKLAHLKNTWFVDYLERMNAEEIFPGVRNLLHTLKTHGYKLGLASSSKNARTVLEVLRLQNTFDAIVDGNMVVHSKPDPEIFILASTMLHVPPPACLVVEDAEAGVEAARRAGMRCIGIGSEEVLGVANRILSKTGDLTLEMLKDLE